MLQVGFQRCPGVPWDHFDMQNPNLQPEMQIPRPRGEKLEHRRLRGLERSGPNREIVSFRSCEQAGARACARREISYGSLERFAG